MTRSLPVLRMPAVGRLVLVYFLSIFAMASFESTLALLTKAAFGMGDDANFLVFAAIGFVLLLPGGCYRPLAKRLPERRLLAAGIMLMLARAWRRSGSWPGGDGPGHRGRCRAAPGGRLFYAAASLAVCGFAFVNPSVSALISRRADADRQGEVLGVNQSFASLARILGPLAGLALFSLHPIPCPALCGTPFAVLLVVALLLPRIRREPPAADPV